MADYHHFSLRFSYDKPEHRKIIDALEDIDKTQYSSKTHFIICAIEHYIKWISLDDSERWQLVREKKGEGDYMTREEFESELENYNAKIKAEMYETMIQFMSGSVQKIPSDMAGNTKASNSNHKDNRSNVSDNLTSDLSQYAGVMESVLSWSEDD